MTKKTKTEKSTVAANAAMPYLVQRLEPSRRPMTGVDGVASCEYMGSAEFEFGALPSALATMREHIDALRVIVLDVRPNEAFMVGREVDRTHVERWFAQELTEKLRHKEMTYLALAYGASKSRFKFDVRTFGWWALDQDVPWVVFKDRDTAERWLAALAAGKPPKEKP